MRSTPDHSLCLDRKNAIRLALRLGTLYSIPSAVVLTTSGAYAVDVPTPTGSTPGRLRLYSWQQYQAYVAACRPHRDHPDRQVPDTTDDA